MTTRFSRYGGHQKSWWLHAWVSPEFKEWHDKSEHNRALFEMFRNSPRAFIEYIKEVNNG